MDRDLTELLDRTSISPHEPVDPEQLRATATHRARARGATVVAGVSILAVAVVPAGIGLLDGIRGGTQDVAVVVDQPQQAVSFDVRLREPDRWTVPASQTTTEALRDGVPAAMALVPAEVRVPTGGPSLPAGNGLTWRFGPGAGSLARLTPDCGGGELCSGQYSEVLLVDGDGQIVLAHALPRVTGGGGFHTTADGHLVGHVQPSDSSGDTIAYRFGTTPGDRDVLVYPAGGSPFLPGESSRWPLAGDGQPIVLPDGWQVLPRNTTPPDALVPGSQDEIRGHLLEDLLNEASR